jgi:hypothetical protein
MPEGATEGEAVKTKMDKVLVISIPDDGTLEMPDGVHPDTVREFYREASENGVEPNPECMGGMPLEMRLLPYTLCG